MTTTKEKKPPTLQQLAESIAAWQGRTFDQSKASSAGAVEHLRREANELWELFWKEGDGSQKQIEKWMRPNTSDVGEEAADVFFMLVQLSVSEGFDLRSAIASKYAKNIKRDWKEPDEHGVVEHVK